MSESEKYLWEGVRGSVPIWHLYCDELLSQNLEPVEMLVADIRAHKPAWQVPTWLRLMRPVKGKLPRKVSEALEENDEFWCPLDSALERYHVEIEALHAKECPNCPWDGKTIFPAHEKGEGVPDA